MMIGRKKRESERDRTHRNSYGYPAAGKNLFAMLTQELSRANGLQLLEDLRRWSFE